LKLSLPKARRLTRTREFAHVRKDGNISRGRLFSLAVASAPEPSEKMRVGIIASRKVGGAVIRNRARRRIREIIRRHQNEIRNGVWLVVIVSNHAARASYAELEHEWLRLAGPALS
jgi:ribonuclease P protein component